MKAKWRTEYDFRSDKAYQCPSCPECDVPLYDLKDDGTNSSNSSIAICSCCDKEVEVDENQRSWMLSRLGHKVEHEKCFNCGDENGLEVLYTRNPVTLEYEVLSGQCKNCGIRFIV